MFSHYFSKKHNQTPGMLSTVKLAVCLMIFFAAGLILHSETSAQTSQPVFGFADLHNHQFANLGFGGGMVHGSSYGDIESALPWCTDKHGPGGIPDPFSMFITGFGHNVGGWPPV